MVAILFYISSNTFETKKIFSVRKFKKKLTCCNFVAVVIGLKEGKNIGNLQTVVILSSLYHRVMMMTNTCV
jgi:hypothetical protein